MNVRNFLVGTIVGIPLAIAAQQAQAAAVVGTSGGSFSSLSSCDNSGSSQDCRIVNTSNGSSTQVQWGSTNEYWDLQNPSTLTAVDLAINATTNANDVVIAQLTWFNNATVGYQTPDVFGVIWSLIVAFTSPSGSSDTEAFNLTITNPTNPPGDYISGMTLADLSNLSFTLNGVVVSDLKYSVQDSTGSNGVNDTYLSNGKWYNDEYNYANLFITADFTHVVPEPASLALFGAGLMTLGFIRRRRSA